MKTAAFELWAAYRGSELTAHVVNVSMLVTGVIVLFCAIVELADREIGLPWRMGYFFLDREDGFPSRFGHAIEFLCMFFLYLCYVKHRNRIFVAFFFAFLFIWIDDSFAYHEQFGAILKSAVNLPSVLGLRTQDLGELLAWILAAAVLGVPFVWAIRGRRPGEGNILLVLGFLFGVLVFFGVGIDMLHMMVTRKSYASLILGWLEDGGELLALAASAAAVFVIYHSPNAVFCQGGDKGRT